jgi:hypothetical protein
MGRACDDARRDLQATMFFPLPSDANETLHRIAARVMAVAACQDESNPCVVATAKRTSMTATD